MKKRYLLRHTTHTWAVANLLHSIALGTLVGWEAGSFLGPILMITVLSYVISLPSLFLAYHYLRLLLTARLSPVNTFCCWLAGLSFLVIAQYHFILYLLFSVIDFAIISFTILPCITAIVITVLIRMNQLFRLVHSHYSPENYIHD